MAGTRPRKTYTAEWKEKVARGKRRADQLYENNSSGYRGVSWHLPNKNGRGWWAAQIRVDGKLIHLGKHETKEKAALAYNKAAKAYWGDDAFQNKVK